MRNRRAIWVLVLTLVVCGGMAAVYVLRRPEPDLFDAVADRSAEEIRHLLDAGQNPDMTDELGFTPLHAAASSGFDRCAKALIEGGASIDVAGKGGSTPLHSAAFYDRALTVALLLQAGAKADVQDANGDTPLHLAVTVFGIRSAELLLQGGASVDVKNQEGKTPLFMAVEWTSDERMVEFLVTHGADVSTTDASGNTLFDAAQGTHIEGLLKRLRKKHSPRGASDGQGEIGGV